MLSPLVCYTCIMQKLRIGVLAPIHHRTPPVGQGAWELISSYITEELVARGHDVILYATGDSMTQATLKSIAPHPLLEPEGANLENKAYGYLHAALPFEDAGQLDIIHNHYDGYPLVMSRLTRVPVVNTIHGFSSPQIKDIYRKYSNVGHVSISLADRRNCPDLNWVANVYHGINLDEIEFGVGPGDYLAFLGRIHPTKGTHIAIEVAKKLGRTLKIAGYIDEADPVVKKYWDEAIAPQIDDKQIIFVGEVKAEAKSQFLKQAQVVLCPIQWEEPFGLVLIESLAAGTPVVAFARGSVPEIIKDGVTGYAVPADDVSAMAKAVEQAGVLDRAKIRQDAEQNFSIARMVSDYEGVYTQMLNRV